MKTRPSTLLLAAAVSLTTLTGCSMTDDDSDTVPFSGTSTSLDAADAMEKVSSGIYDLIGVKGKASESYSTVMDCSGEDAEKYFRILHPWSFYPDSVSDLDVAMERLKSELSKHGWEIVDYGPDTSKNKNIRMTADNDRKKVSVRVIKMAKNDPPKLSLNVVSGCYEIPEGQEIERF
ncbi:MULTISPECIES: hypothetical protein [Streptomyces]|uniref:hypothetical protein n=1 Tax=Streptomyces sp. H-KF8 TaxID=1727216 RepID=UPI0007ED8E37|nr:hypothetical protein [Streptomyces sp. H-KF8]OBQ48406.1 hypothetical protein A4U61_25120 [Streptomyces sp. H-KF8]